MSFAMLTMAVSAQRMDMMQMLLEQMLIKHEMERRTEQMNDRVLCPELKNRAAGSLTVEELP